MAGPASDGYTEKDWKSFMVVGINLPIPGCWQITTRYESDELTYVVWVADSQLKRQRWTMPDLKALSDRAESGDSSAQFWLGAAYEQGWFGKANYQKALVWLKKAAAHGHPDAQVSLGQMYEDGERIQQDYARAAYWYRTAAKHVPDLGGAS
jgi:hypothetical protein